MNEEQIDALSWLDKTFTESILRREENDADLSVLEIDVRSAVPKGDNYASLLVRVAVDYLSRQPHDNIAVVKKMSLIVKTLPLGELMQVFMTATGLFKREAHIYEVTLPKIYKLIEEKTGTDQEHMATNIYACDRPDTLVLQDLRPLDYKMADRRQGLDLHHSVKAIRILAKLHASSMVLHAEDPESMDFYKESIYTEENRKFHVDFMENTFKNIATEVENWPGFERYADKLRVLAPRGVDLTMEAFQNKDGALRVLNHGDFWVNNMLFRYEDGKVADIKILDFQMVRFASPALDILYFLHTSITQDCLEDFWDQLIGEYHESFTDTLSYLGDDRVVTLEDINREMQDKAHYAVIISCMFCLMVADPEDAPDLSQLTQEDMDNGTANDTMNKALAGKRFRAAFERRLPKFEAQGLI